MMKLWVRTTTDKIIAGMANAQESMRTANVRYLEVDAKDYIRNRLAGDAGTKDGKIRAVQFDRSDGKKALLFTYGAHATTISSASRSLSGDYPAKVMEALRGQGWDFATYMGGMVGSHALAVVGKSDFDIIENAGVALSEKFDQLLRQIHSRVLR